MQGINFPEAGNAHFQQTAYGTQSAVGRQEAFPGFIFQLSNPALQALLQIFNFAVTRRGGNESS